MKVYCCDKHGRFFIIRTIDGVRRPIAIALVALRDKNPTLYEALARDLLPLRKEWAQNGKTGSIELSPEQERELMKIVGELDIQVDVNKILDIVDSLRARASKKASLKLSSEARVAVAQETGEMIKHLFGMDIDTFLKENLENVSRYLNKNDAEFARKAIVTMIYESLSRMLILKEKLPLIHKLIRDALRPECKDFNIIVVGSTTRLEATFDSDIEFLVYYEDKEDFLKCYRQYIAKKEVIEKDMSRLLGINVQTRIACVEAFRETYKITTRETAEKHAEWLGSALIDGEPILDNIDWRSYMKKLKDQTKEKRRKRQGETVSLIGWIRERLRSAIDDVDPLGGNPKGYHRIFSSVMRAHILKN